MFTIEKIHHVAYRCDDAKTTVEWYKKNLNMEFMLAIAENEVPSTKEPDPYMHIFLNAGNGNVLAFFELPNSPPMQKDPNTPEWVQHIALEVKDKSALQEAKNHLESNDVDVLGIVAHGIFKSIYFFDPSGHRIELTYREETQEKMNKLKKVAPLMIDEWSKTKRAPNHADWLHKQ